jgi:hypothetical protein
MEAKIADGEFRDGSAEATPAVRHLRAVCARRALAQTS